MAGIVWLASYPKSGNTWVRAFLHNLMRDPARSYDINRLSDLTAGDSQIAWYRGLDPSLGEDYPDERIRALRPQVHRAIAASSPDSVFAKTHNALIEEEGQPLVALEATAGAIYVVRNPLDVAVSFSHHNAVGIDEIIDFMARPGARSVSDSVNVYEVYGSWSEHVASWTATTSSRLHVMRYEDMLANAPRSFGALVAFLGLEASRQRIAKAIRLSSFGVLREQERRHRFREKPAVADRFFRAGTAGQWRKRLTPAQVAAVVAAHREQMARFAYLPDGY
jgi:hypothetical protein